MQMNRGRLIVRPEGVLAYNLHRGDPVDPTRQVHDALCVWGDLHLFGRLGGAGAQLPGVSDVSPHKGKRAKGTRRGAETHCGSAPSSHFQQAPQHRAQSTAH